MRRLLPLLAAAGAAFVVLVGLGLWQLERLRWKEDVIARVEARRVAAPQPLPPEADWPALRPDDIDYRRVALRGVYGADRSALVFRGAGPNAPGAGPGYLVLTPLRLADGAVVVVNRGFAPLAEAQAAAIPPAGEITVTGLMRPPEPRNPFTPADEPGKGVWYTRDPASIAAAFGLSRAAPFTVDADAAPDAAGWPRAGATQLDIPNNHLSYALTWFGLAAGLAGVTGAYAMRLRKSGEGA